MQRGKGSHELDGLILSHWCRNGFCTGLLDWDIKCVFIFIEPNPSNGQRFDIMQHLCLYFQPSMSSHISELAMFGDQCGIFL